MHWINEIVLTEHVTELTYTHISILNVDVMLTWRRGSVPLLCRWMSEWSLWWKPCIQRHQLLAGRRQKNFRGENICHWQVTREVMTRLRPTGCIITATLAPALWICIDVNSRQIVDVNPRLSVVKKHATWIHVFDVNSRRPLVLVVFDLLVKNTSRDDGQTDVNSRRREKARTRY